MHLAKYEAYIGRLERIADRSHFRFRLRVVALVAFGYALMLLMLTGIFLTAALLVVCRLIVRAARMLALGCHFCVGLCRGMWIKFDPSETIQLDPEQMRPIVEIVDELCAQLGAPKIDRVSVSFDCNAAARQRPKFGPFGPFRNEVTLGLPLLAVFTLEEVRAIIAHEIGHIHRGHVRFAIRVGQISHAWQKALEEIDKNRISAKSLVWVFNWYAPKLRGAQHVLSRISEREANKAEASVAGVAVHVQVCVTLAIYTRVSKDVLTDMYQDSYSQSEMPLDLLVKMCEALGRPRTEESMTELVQQELSLPYNPFSTHPPMSQIVRELGVDPSTAF
jgi:Zn-dependent protease with chaperone function